MNREWSDKNKLAQSKLKKATFYDGINEFLKLREMLMQEILDSRINMTRLAPLLRVLHISQPV